MVTEWSEGSKEVVYIDILMSRQVVLQQNNFREVERTDRMPFGSKPRVSTTRGRKLRGLLLLLLLLQMQMSTMCQRLNRRETAADAVAATANVLLVNVHRTSDEKKSVRDNWPHHQLLNLRKSKREKEREAICIWLRVQSRVSFAT